VEPRFVWKVVNPFITPLSLTPDSTENEKTS